MSNSVNLQYYPFSNTILNPTTEPSTASGYYEMCWNTSNTHLYLFSSTTTLNDSSNCPVVKVSKSGVVTSLTLYNDNNPNSKGFLFGQTFCNAFEYNDAIYFVRKQQSYFYLYQMITLNDSDVQNTMYTFRLPVYSNQTPLQVSYSPTNNLFYVLYINVTVNTPGNIVTINPALIPTAPAQYVDLSACVGCCNLITTPTLPYKYINQSTSINHTSALAFDNFGNAYFNLGNALFDTSYNSRLYGIYKSTITNNNELTNPSLLPFIPDASYNVNPTKLYVKVFFSSLKFSKDYIFALTMNINNYYSISVFSYDGVNITYDLEYYLGNRFSNGIDEPYALDNLYNIYMLRGDGTKYIMSKLYTSIKVTICFKKDTQILTINGYKPIQNLHKGDLIQTHKHGYVPIYKIGFSEMKHECLEQRIKEQLYKCSPDNYPEIFEDLVLTGCHSILVDSFISDEQKEKSIELNGDLYITDDKYRLPVCLDEKATVYDVPGKYTIYHMALENDEYYMNYGIYANGLLVESTSKRFMDGLKMIEN